MRGTPFLLHRYLGGALTGATLAAVGIFVFLLMAGNLLRDVLGLLADGRLSPKLFLQLLGLLFPYVIAFALPLGLLTGILLVLGRLSAQNEITAMRAAGISLRQIALPAYVLALLSLVFSVWVNFSLGPNARTLYRSLLADTVRERPLEFVTEGRFVRDFPGVIFYIEEKDGDLLRGIRLWELDREGRVQHLLTAATGQLAFQEDDESLRLTLNRGFIERRPDRDERGAGIRMATFGEWGVRLPLDEVFRQPAPTRSLSRMDIFMLIDRLSDIPREERVRGEPRFGEWVKVRMEISERLAMSMATVCLAFLAIPLGVKIQRRDTSSNLLIAFGLAMGFYVLMILFGWLAVRPQWRPDYLIWIPNGVVVAWGIYFFRKVQRT